MTDDNGKTTIAVICDVHFGEDAAGSRRRCSIGDVLLERAVRRTNALIRPDVVLVLGDLVDDSDAADVAPRLQALKRSLDRLEAPYLVIPGNHDPAPERFYDVLPRPGGIEDIAGVRFLAFVDREQPGYNATRSDADLERIRAARAGHDGPIVALQHVCLHPPGRDLTPYNYTNADSIVAALKEAGVVCSVSGHHHPGAEDYEEGGVTFVTAPGLCEAPFFVLEITLDGDRVETRRHALAMPESLGLIDNHLHTQLAYCSENMDVEKTIALAREFGLAGLTFTEHSGHLYFDQKSYRQSVWLQAGVAGAPAASNRVGTYLELKQAHEGDFARFSLEADCDARGKLVLKAQDRENLVPPIGAIHALPGLTRDAPPTPRELDTFLFMVDEMGKDGIRVLAHPMRVFGRTGWPVPEALFEPTAKLLRQHGVATEINYHTHRPPVDFVRCCLDHGVTVSFASDAHNLAEVGDFACHMDVMREAGYDGDFSDILKQPQ